MTKSAGWTWMRCVEPNAGLGLDAGICPFRSHLLFWQRCVGHGRSHKEVRKGCKWQIFGILSGQGPQLGHNHRPHVLQLSFILNTYDIPSCAYTPPRHSSTLNTVHGERRREMLYGAGSSPPLSASPPLNWSETWIQPLPWRKHWIWRKWDIWRPVG